MLIDEERRDEEKQREARQDDLRKRSAESLGQIQAQASVIVDDVRSWAADAARLPEGVPPAPGFLAKLASPRGVYPRLAEEGVRRLLPKYEEVVQQRDSIAARISSLCLYSREQVPSLPITARNLIEAFNKYFESRYNPLSSQLPSYPLFRQRFKLREDVPLGDKVGGVAVDILLSSFPFGVQETTPLLASVKSLAEEWAGLPEAASYAQDWDFDPYRVAFEKEIKKLSGTST